MSKTRRIRFGTRFYGTLFMLLIVAFAFVYYILPEGYIDYGVDEVSFINSLYFSIVTITTLGYGDILPVDQVALAIVSLESVMGVITIGFYLNAVSANLSKSISDSEKEIELRKNRISEIERILHFNKLHQITVNNYVKYATVITTPFEHRAVKEFQNYRSDFKINEMSDLFKMSLLTTDKTYEPAIIKYYNYEKILINDYRHIIINFSVELLGELENDILELIEFCLEYDFSESIIGALDIKIGDNKSIETIEKLIKEYKGEPRFLESHILNPYVALYIQLNSIDELIKKYDEKIESLTNELKVLKLA